jgi:hypothetical protein
MRRLRKWAVALSVAATIVMAAATGLSRADSALPGSAADAKAVAAIYARGSDKACAAIADKCQGNRPESTVCLTATGGCAARSLVPPDTGAGAPCGTCTGTCHNTCSGAPLTPPTQCWETSTNCCTVTTACASVGGGCVCTAGAPAQPIGTRIVCWNAPPAAGGGQPPPPNSLITMDCTENGGGFGG